MALALFRAIESRRYLVRATITGISVFIDPAGRIVEQTPTYARANLLHNVALLEGLSVYTRFGDWLAWLCLLATLVFFRKPLRTTAKRVLFARVRRRQKKR